VDGKRDREQDAYCQRNCSEHKQEVRSENKINAVSTSKVKERRQKKREKRVGRDDMGIHRMGKRGKI